MLYCLLTLLCYLCARWQHFPTSTCFTPPLLHLTTAMQTGIGMAIGLLFLGQGRASLRRDPLSLGALLLSTTPRFPTRTLGK